MFANMTEGEVSEVNVVIKADVQALWKRSAMRWSNSPPTK